MKRFAGLLFLMLSTFAGADVVVPIEAVENSVNIRMSADSASEIVGRLNQGDYLPLVESTAEWHEVEISGGATGFISADWTVVLDEPPAVAEEVETPTEGGKADEAVAAVEIASSAVDKAVDEADDMVVADTDVVTDAIADLSVEVEEASAADVVDEQVASAEEVVMDESSDVNDVVADADVQKSTAEPEDVIDEVNDVVEESFDAPVEEVVEATAEAIPVLPGVESEVAIAEPEESASDHLTTAVTDAGPGLQGLPGLSGPQGIPGPPGPAGAATIEGSVGFLTRFTAPTIGGTSQVFDDGNNIGIGTTEPKQRLEVNGNIQIHERNSSVAGLMITQSDGDTGYIMHNRASTLTIGAGSIDRITIDRDGNVGFGVSRPKNPLEMSSGAHVTAGGVWTNSSSRARKENIAELSLDDALATLTELEPVQFNYRNDPVESYVGFIAEDVPELVATSARDGLSSMDIVAVLTRVVQEQQKKIEALEARLDQR